MMVPALIFEPAQLEIAPDIAMSLGIALLIVHAMLPEPTVLHQLLLHALHLIA
jgi:hypothetical protein